MNNKEIEESINKLMKMVEAFWEEIVIENGFSEIPFSTYTTRFNTNYPDNVNVVRVEDDARMVTLFVARGEENPNIPEDDHIVQEIQSGVFMSLEQLYLLIIECGLDWQKAFECMKFTLRHELGHIIDVYRTHTGISVKEWNEFVRIKELESSVNKQMINTSKENRLEGYLQYFNTPAEKRANDTVGITEQDIIDDFNRTNSYRWNIFTKYNIQRTLG